MKRWLCAELCRRRGSDTGLEAARAIAEALNTKGVALARLGRNREAVGEVEQSVAVAEAADLLNVACRGYANLGVLYTISIPHGRSRFASAAST